MFFIESDIKDTKRKRALLLYLGGKELQKIHRTLNDESDTYEKAKELLDSHFKPKANVTFEQNKFYNLHQMENETISAFVTRLKDASRTCDFENYSQESAIVDSVISKCVSNRLRRRLLREPKLDLKTLLEISFTTESAEQQATEMEKHEEHNINKVLPSKNDHKQYSKFSKAKPQSNSGQDEKKLVHCYGCGSNSHTHGSINCPAKGKTCNYCKKPNHFASVCFKNKPKTEPLNDEQNKNVQQII